MKKLGLYVLLMIFLSGMMITMAQEGDGQVCIRAFEDRNSNGSLDANEPPITRAIGVNLMNSLSVTIDSKLLDDSPTAAQGVVCFQQLSAGDYMIVVTSADYAAVTSTVFNASVVPGAIPTRFDFGAQSITADSITITDANPSSGSDLTPEEQNNLLQGIFFGGIGAVIVMGAMFIVGLLIYFGVFRRRMNNLPSPTTTGSFRPVTGPMPAAHETGQHYAVRPDTGQLAAIPPDNRSYAERNRSEGSPPLFAEEDTDQMGAV